MKKKVLTALICAALCLAFPVFADQPEPVVPEPDVPEPVEPVEPEPVGEIITGTNTQSYAIDAYQLLEQSLQFAYGGYPDHYAGCWLEGDTLCVGVTTEDEGVRSIYLDILAPAKCRIEYRVVKYSYNQLMIFNEVIWSGHAVDPLAEPISLADTCGLNSSGIVTDRNCVEITSEQGYSDGLYAALVSFAEDMGADEDIFDLEESAIAIMPAMEEVIVEEAPAPTLAVELPVGLSMNPLKPYFTETYGENVYPNHYAGCWHESTAVLPSSSDADESGEVSMEMSGGLVLHIMLAEEVDEETLAKYRDLCIADAAFISDLDFSVVFDYAEYSYNTLRYLKDEAKARYEARVGTEKYLWSGIDEPNNRVILRCEEYDDALRTVVDELTEEFGKSGALFEVIETEVVIAEPQARPVESPIEALPEFEVTEEATSADDVNKVTGFYPNPLEEYFFSEYGEGVYPDDYAGCWFSNRFDMHIMLTEDVTDENRLKYMDIACLSHVGVISTETVVFSMNDLNHALAELKSRFGDEYGIGKVHGEINEAYNRIDLTVNYLNDEREAILESIASELGEDGWYRLFAVSEPADASPSADCDGPPENYAPVSVYADPMDEYAHENNGYPDYYAGHRYPFGDLIVYVTEDADENDLAEIRAIYGGDVSIETRKYSLNQLIDAYENALERSENTVWGGIDIDKNRVVLHTFEPVEKTDELLRRTAVRIGVENDIFELNESTYPDTTADQFVIESGSPSDAAAVLLDEWESKLLNPPSDYLGYSKAGADTIVIKVTKNDEETFDKFRSIVAASGCDIEFKTVNNSAVEMEAYRDLLEKQIGYYDKNPYKIDALGISDDGDGYVYVLREKYVMGEDTTDELAEYIENIMRTHRQFDDCEVKILEYVSSPDSFDYLRDRGSEEFFVTESIALKAAEPQTSPRTSDPATILSLLISAIASAGICLTKKR